MPISRPSTATSTGRDRSASPRRRPASRIGCGAPARADTVAAGGAGNGAGSPRFTLRQLRCFVAVAEAGSVTGAAEALALSPSSVSAAVAQLEQTLGLSLFLRHHARGVTPTRAGERVLQEARDLLRRAGALGNLASELARVPAGPLAIGCLVTLAPVVLPGLLASFLARFPAVEP
ncbi:MAG TPA: LysR family transcriptional regulator, partial [Rhodospirillales bacterium]|nr:LysR family transcriptional regulator [Rhodospirillales bacterium]